MRMTALIHKLCIICTLSSSIAFAAPSQIHTIKSMHELEKYIDKQTVVIFDLDHTVYESKNYGYGHANWFYDQVEEGKAKGINEKAVIFNVFPHWLVSQENIKLKPVESQTPALIKKLQKEGFLVLGLTGRQVPLVDLTLKQMKEINVDFTSPKLKDETIYGFHASTVMKDGVIFCSEYNDKGEVLHAYLDKHNIKPQKIVFVDDGMRNLQSVTKAYSNIEVIGLHYPLVAEFKKTHWDGKSAHQEYCSTYKKHAELQDYPLDCLS